MWSWNGIPVHNLVSVSNFQAHACMHKISTLDKLLLWFLKMDMHVTSQIKEKYYSPSRSRLPTPACPLMFLLHYYSCDNNFTSIKVKLIQAYRIHFGVIYSYLSRGILLLSLEEPPPPLLPRKQCRKWVWLSDQLTTTIKRPPPPSDPPLSLKHTGQVENISPRRK